MSAFSEILDISNTMKTILKNDSEEVAFFKFKELCNNTVNINDIYTEDAFKQTVSLIFNEFDNHLILNYVIENSKKILKENSSQFLKDLEDSIFKNAISSNKLKNIEKYMPQDFNIEECLQISIKYCAWDSFELFLNNHVENKQRAKTLKWSQKEYWDYVVHGFAGNLEFFKNLTTHPLSVLTPVKQPIYSLLQNSSFSFLNTLMNEDTLLPVLQDINKEYYYKLLIKTLSELDKNSMGMIDKKDLNSQHGIELLQKSYKSIPFDFSTFKFNKKFHKENPEIIDIITTFILKDKEDLFENKKSEKQLKI